MIQYAGYKRKTPIPSDLMMFNHIIGSVRLLQTKRAIKGNKCQFVMLPAFSFRSHDDRCSCRHIYNSQLQRN